ncbi:chemotaxis protein CheX [Methylogaea oryzae]|uniref:chemotaxis protein CheX n=1 Tax=Methylogaea oryzae TaxID=1295382 RepID=UPI000A8E5C89
MRWRYKVLPKAVSSRRRFCDNIPALIRQNLYCIHECRFHQSVFGIPDQRAGDHGASTASAGQAQLEERRQRPRRGFRIDRHGGAQCKGSMSITFDADLAYEIMFRMVGERPKSMNDEVTDMVGEITNMVTGGAKRILAEKGYEFGMATPTVVTGLSHRIIHKSKGPKLIMPFNSQWGKAHIEISFESQDAAPAAPAPDAAGS